jgi:hypothetical protein
MPISYLPLKWFVWSLSVSALALAVTPGPRLAELPSESESALKQMLGAIQASEYDEFVAQAESRFKAGFTRQMFESVGKQLAPRLKNGYSSSYLGKLNQGGYAVYVWKLEFKDGNDDFLVTLFIKEGKVGGFFAR